MTHDGAREARLAELLEALTYEGRCSLDHEGYCQAHDWLSSARPCPHGEAQGVLETYRLTGRLG